MSEENGKGENGQSSKQKFRVFLILLLALFALAVLFGTGVLRFGITGPFVYIVYVFAGLLAAYLTFGMLSSTGEVEGEHKGTRIKFGGAAAAFIVVAAGGGLYERYLHTPPSFDQLFLLYAENPTKPEPVSGELILVVPNRAIPEHLDGSGRALFRGLSSQYLGGSYQLQLQSPNYEIVSNYPVVLSGNENIGIKVKWQRTWEEPKKATVRVTIESGSAVNYGPRPDQKNINFELKLESKSALPVPLSKKAKVQLMNSNGVPLESFDFAVVGERAVVAPRSISYVHIDGMVPKDAYARIRNGRMLTVTLAYDSDIEKSDAIFQTMPFEMNESNFQDYAKGE